MIAAFLSRDGSYDGVFFTGVRTTGIFCRPTCSAKKPRRENVDFYPTTREALMAGFRPCKRCRPMEPSGVLPTWLDGLMKGFEAEPERRWTDQDLRTRGLSPERVRRWFQSNHGMTFHAYSRVRRLGLALGQIQQGSRVSRAAFSTGYESLSGFNEAFKRFVGQAPRDVKSSTVVAVNRIPTPLGPMVAGAVDDALCLLEFADRRMLETQLVRLQKHLDCVFVPGTSEVFDRLAEELEAYFKGEETHFSAKLLTPGTPFQQQVWTRLRASPPAVAMVAYPDREERYRFCTEALVRGEDLPTQTEVRDQLRERGDSMIVIRSGDVLKLHIHTDDPDDVFGYLKGLGNLVTHKAEDMKAQHAAVGRAGTSHLSLARRPVGIVTDSAADLPEEIVRAHGIQVVSLMLVDGDAVYRDGVDVTAEQFHEMLTQQEALPTTSQPPPGGSWRGSSGPPRMPSRWWV